MHTSFFWALLACGDKTTSQDTATENTEDTSNLSEDTATNQDTNTTEDTGPRPPIRPFCKTLSYVDQFNGATTNEATYTWNGNTQVTDTATSTFNDYGYQLTSETEYEGWMVLTENTYECDGWCKLLSSTSSQGYDASSMEITETTYQWNDNTQIQDVRYWVYNEMGYVLEFHDERDGFSNTTTYEYECNDTWCKLMKGTTVTTNDEGTDQMATSYSWEGNTRTDPNGSTRFNDYGYITHRITESTVGVSEQLYTYDCGE